MHTFLPELGNGSLRLRQNDSLYTYTRLIVEGYRNLLSLMQFAWNLF